MKSTVWRILPLLILSSITTALWAQPVAPVDTTWLFFSYMPNGTRLQGAQAGGQVVDIRLRTIEGTTTTTYYLSEGKTFSFRKSNGVPTDSYHPMAGFTSTSYTQGQLRSNNNWNQDLFRQNYRLMFPKNYNTNPNVEGGYPLIVMIHGFGERGNCWGTNCYWANGIWDPNVNTIGNRQIVSVESNGGALFTIATTPNLGEFPNNAVVYIRTNVSQYNGIRRLVKVSNTQFRLSTNLTSTSASTGIIGFTAGFTSGNLERYRAETYRIISAEDAGGGLTRFTTNQNHQFPASQQVTISNSTVSSYNGSRTISNVTETTFTMSVSFNGTATADAHRSSPNALQLLNNDHSMTHGGRLHMDAINAVPSGMEPNDPAMPPRAFPGFMLYAQNLNGWGPVPSENWNVIRIIRLLMKKYNIDPNRIYIHGLSDGGSGAYRVMRNAPWMFSGALPMSAVDNAQITANSMYPYVMTVPLWLFQGGTDGNPPPSKTYGYHLQYQNQGMSSKYTLYPSLGHGVWNNAYAETDFFTWMLRKRKSDIFVRYGSTEICSTSGAGVELLLAQGFHAYQWEKDGVLIPGATSYAHTANIPGVYRARFSRVPNPAENDWNNWSKPVTVTESSSAKPIIATNNTTVFPCINGTEAVTLKAAENATRYMWYRNGTLINSTIGAGNEFQDTVSQVTINPGSTTTGVYTLKTASVSYCESPTSEPVYYLWNIVTPTVPAPTNFAGQAVSPSSIFLTWTDNSNGATSETGFEVWRRKAGETVFKFVTLTAEDIISYLDTGLESGTTYEYKLRAVSSTGRSTHAPADALNNNLVVATTGDATPPTPPQNLQVTFNTINSITLQWEPGTDDSGVKQYRVNYGGNSVYTNSTLTTFTITGLTINQAYPITVQTEDFDDNLSPPSNQVIGTTYVDGLYYDHSTGAWNSLDPDLSAAAGDSPPIDWVTAEFTGKIANFNVTPKVDDPNGIATQQDFYKIKFDGYLNIPNNPSPQTQVYQFRITSDDGSMLFLNDFDPNDVTYSRYANNDGIHGAVTVPSGNPNSSWDRTLAPGPHRIVVLFNEYTGGQSLTVQYRVKNNNNSYGSWITIPDAMLRTGIYTPPTPPGAPNSLAALATGMTSIDLTWAYGGAPEDEFEVYRSLTTDGTYAVVGRATGLAFTDNTALPGTEYFYKLKTVNDNGTSILFSNIASATTPIDNIAPSIPAGLTLSSKTFSNVAFFWTASTDNVGVAGYEVLIDDVVVDTTTVASYMATGLEPGTLYNFTVKAFDASGNKSAASAALAVTTNPGQMFFSKSTGALNIASNWGINADGSGTAPNFAVNGQLYTVANRETTGLGGSLTIGGSASKLIVPTGATLNIDNAITARLEVQGTAIVNLNHSTAPQFTSISPTSTINFNTYHDIPVGSYGNVILSGSGSKDFSAGETEIHGNLICANGIALKGMPGNSTKLTLHGDLTFSGTPGLVAFDNAIDLVLVKNGNQTLTVGGPIDFFSISTEPGTNVDFVNGGTPVTLNVGASNGGGLKLATGSTLNLGNNHLVLRNAGTINSTGETGTLAVNGGNLNLSSSSSSNSNLYLDNTNHATPNLSVNFSSTGKLVLHSPLYVTAGLKVNAGEVDANGHVTLISNSTSTAYIHEIEGNGKINGNVNIQRWVSTARKYRYMSSAVAGMKVADWQLYMPITGPFTGSSPNTTNPSMFYYVEDDGGYKNYPHTGSNNQVTFASGRGYSIFNYNGNSPLTLVMTGNPHQGEIDYTPLLTSGSGGNDGWNLIGNPYASAIQWNNLATDWTRSGVSPVVHVPDNTGGSLVFRTYDATTGLGTLTGGIIAPGQAFWVQTVFNPTLAVRENAKRTNASTFYREGDTHINSITIRLSNGSLEDEAYIVIGDSYADTYDPESDGMKLKNGILNLSTRSIEPINLVFNKVSDSFCEKTIALNIEDVAPGTYSLSFDNIENLVGVGSIELTDHFTNTSVFVTGAEPYNFSVTSNAASYGAGRFTLTLNRPALQKNAVAVAEDICGGDLARIQLTNTQPGVFYYASQPDDATPLSETVSGDEGSLTLHVPVGTLQSGANSLVIRTGYKGCSNELLTAAPLEFTYTPAPQVSIDIPVHSVCENSQVMLKAETSPENSYRWFKDGEVLPNQTSASWLSEPVSKTTLFEVAAVINGCEGTRASIYVEVLDVPKPEIEFHGEVLEIVNDISTDYFIQWYKDNEPMEAFDRGIKPVAEGIYTVLVSKDGCAKLSDDFEYLVTSVDHPVRDGFNAYVYPNPASHTNLYVKIESISSLDAQVVIMDVTGKAVFDVTIQGPAANGVHRLNVSQEIAPGMYIMLIRQGDMILQRKVILKAF